MFVNVIILIPFFEHLYTRNISVSFKKILQGSQSSGVGVEEDGNLSVLSVRQRAQHLNKISSEVDLNQARTPPRKKVSS